MVALSHRSWCSENPGTPSNERLEFLGDAVLGLVVTDSLYSRFPDQPEGQLAKTRAAVVNASSLAEVGVALGLGDDLRLGKGEDGSGGREKASILADAVEAVIGAVYLDGGLDAARTLVLGQLDRRISDAASRPGARDYKTRLQEVAAADGDAPPVYTISESGPDHHKKFEASVSIGDVVRGTGDGSSKKEAEQRAARAAWEARTPEDGASDV
jgi:ribonuclease III